MKRNFRSAKFAEYLSTFALLHQIHLHPTLLIEKRDPSRGYGMYARDAVDAGTTMVVLPRRSLMTSSALDTFGVGLSGQSLQYALRSATDGTSPLRERFAATDLLLMGVAPETWIVFAWQLSIELSARHSFWWGWLSSVPSLADLVEQEQAAHLASRAVAPHLVGQMATIRTALKQELDDAYSSFVVPHAVAVPTRESFYWAARLVLTRSIVAPRESSLDEGDVDLAMAPFIDLCNMASRLPTKPRSTEANHGAVGNAQVEFLGTGEELPKWSRDEIDASQFKTADSDDHRHAVLLTLHTPLLPGDEVLVDDAVDLLSETLHDASASTTKNRLLSTHPSLLHPDMASILRMQRYHIPL
jgi:hypothetical protein